jgi:peptidoglycan/xylan/chitin deacetylase (PgdA/CDA1 family)
MEILARSFEKGKRQSLHEASRSNGFGTLAAFETSMYRHLATIDLDDGRPRPGPSASSDLSARVDQLLETLSTSSAQATFFAPPDVARAGADVLRRISSAGHEVACLTTIAPSGRAPYCSEFRQHIRSARAAVEDATGVRVRGHRASRFGVDSASEWAYDVLVDEGFEYDSSRFPTRNPAYGCAVVPASVHAIRRWTGTLLEVPVTTADVFAMRFQVGTVASIRGLPLGMSQRLVRARESLGEPAVIHLRWSEMAERRRLAFGAGSGATRGGEARTLARVARLLESFQFTSVERELPGLLRSAPIIES